MPVDALFAKQPQQTVALEIERAMPPEALGSGARGQPRTTVGGRSATIPLPQLLR